MAGTAEDTLNDLGPASFGHLAYNPLAPTEGTNPGEILSICRMGRPHMKHLHLAVEEIKPHGIKVENFGDLPDHLLEDRFDLEGLIDGCRHVIKNGKLLGPLLYFLFQSGIRGLQFRGHLVKFLGQLFDFISGTDLDSIIEVTLADNLSPAMEFTNRPRYLVAVPYDEYRTPQQPQT